MIQVNTYRFFELYKEFPNLVVPDYQRAYTWNIAKVDELIQDWEEYIDTKPKQTYYMGSVLLFSNTKDANFQIIDGQQRLTTLLIFIMSLRQVIHDWKDDYPSDNDSFDRRIAYLNQYLSYYDAKKMKQKPQISKHL